ncbi:MAG: hypothetical protein RIR59_1183 [Pseudomonadota bacterium]|jgi:hypothetical protein
MSPFGKLLRLTAPLILLGAAGCAQSFNAKVSRFQQMPPAQGQSFTVKAADPAQDGGLEFASYAQLVAGKLTALGYRPAAANDTANLVVKLDYTVDRGREKIRSAPSANRCWGYYDPWCGGFAYWGRPYRGRYLGYYPGFYDPFLFGPGGFDSGIESYTVFTSELNLRIERADNGERVFEGKAQAQSLNDNLTYLVPNLVEAMFTGFPGNSGETVKITVPPPAKQK